MHALNSLISQLLGTRPDLICKESGNSNIVWDIALFEWVSQIIKILSVTRTSSHSLNLHNIDHTPKVERIQSYKKDGWNYIDQLHQFVDEGMADVSFINKVSEIVTGAVGSEVPFTGQRWSNYNMLLDSLQLRGDANFAPHARGFGNFDFWMRWSSAVKTDARDSMCLGFILCTILLRGFRG